MSEQYEPGWFALLLICLGTAAVMLPLLWFVGWLVLGPIAVALD